MTHLELETMWKCARYIFVQSKLQDVKRNARRICEIIEETKGQIHTIPAKNWEI